MSKKEYDWAVGEPPPLIQLHSLAKHRVYEEYINHYIKVLNSLPTIPSFRVTLIDGFAGGGLYRDPRDGSDYPGSPLRLIRAAESAGREINLQRKIQGIRSNFELHADYHYIESKPTNHQYLDWYLSQSEFGHLLGKHVHTRQGKFTDILPSLMHSISSVQKKRRCIFFLDQYGYTDVPFYDIQTIFSTLPNAEIILTFATDWLIDYMANTASFKKTMNRIGLDSELDIENLVSNKKDNTQWRQVVQHSLHEAIQKLSSAKYYTPFFILSTDANKSFWLVHLSNHPKARDVMTQLHWQIENQFVHYGDTGLNMFGYNAAKDSTIDLLSGSEFSFDQQARSITLEKILIDLPSLIHTYPDGVRFDKFYSMVANQTPATTDHIRQAAEILIQVKELDIRGPNGERRLKSNTIRNHDIIKPPSQKTIAIPYNISLSKPTNNN